MSELRNAGTSQASGTVTCRKCGYSADIQTYKPAYSVYHDCRCPQCGSTNNEHNDAYATKLLANMRPSPAAEP